MINEKERKDYYQRVFESELKVVDEAKDKPTLFLHACCGPCLTYPLSILIQYFRVTVGYFNPNIYPESEYEKRLFTLKRFIDEYGKDHGVEIPLVLEKENFQRYQEAFKERFQDYEGGMMCLRCHSYRMGLAYQYASEHRFDYFTTVMTVSCKKPSRELNEIAEKLSLSFPNTKYLYSDFKKNDGMLKGILIARQYQLYRQDYCGCLPSLLEREEQKKHQSQKNLIARK